MKWVREWVATGWRVGRRGWAWVRDRVCRHGGKLSLVVGLVVLSAGVGLIAGYWDWLTGNESPSATIRNVGLVIGGAIALGIACWRGLVANRQARAARGQAEAAQRQAEAAQRQAETAQADLRNKRYQESAGMLGSGVLAVRLAGIYALQRLAEDHPKQYHVPIMKSLCAFVRHPIKDEDPRGVLEAKERAAATPTGVGPRHELRGDVQAAMQAICACHAQQLRLEQEAEFSLELDHVDLKGAWLHSANLSDAELTVADLTGATLNNVDLTGARLVLATLISADLSGADMTHAFLIKANLTDAKLFAAKLGSAKLIGANLTGTRFTRSPHPIFGEPDPMEAIGLTQEQLDAARADPGNPPKLDGVLDAKTGKQLVWRGMTLDYKSHPDYPENPDD